jgi:F-type H+-transporting ATPase subunit b
MEYQAFHAVPWQHGSFWVMVAIVIFVVLFAKKIVQPVLAMLDSRTASVQTALEEAAALKREAEALLADAKVRQAKAISDAETILAQAEAEAARTREQLGAEARAVARRRERLALDRIAAAEKAALEEVRSVAIDVATSTAATLLRTGFAADQREAMVDHAISGIPSALRRAL